MTWRLLLPLLTSFLLVWTAIPALSQSEWITEVETQCASCHDIEEVCENLDESESYWRETLERMVGQWGVDLSEEEIATWARKLTDAPEKLRTGLCP